MYLLLPLLEKAELTVVMAVLRLLVATLTAVVVVVVVVFLLRAAGRWYLSLLLLRRSELTVVRTLVLLTVLLGETMLLEEVAEGDGMPLVSIRLARRTISSKETRRIGFGESTSVTGEFCLPLSARCAQLEVQIDVGIDSTCAGDNRALCGCRARQDKGHGCGHGLSFLTSYAEVGGKGDV